MNGREKAQKAQKQKGLLSSIRRWCGRDQGSAAASPYQETAMFSPQAVPLWTEDFAMQWRSWLQTSAGVAFRLRLQAMVCEVAISGCQNAQNAMHAAGVGAGWNECARKLIEMADPKRYRAEQLEQKFSGAASATAATNDPPPEGETALIERLSP